MNEREAEKLLAENKIDNFEVDPRTGKVTVKKSSGPEVGLKSWDRPENNPK